MKIIDLDITLIKPYENNPRKISEKAVDKVATSIKEFGWKQPIVVNKDYVIIVGHTRLFAARKLKLSVVPVTIADDLDDAKIKAYRLADNRTNQESEWNFDFLKTEFSDLTEIDFDLSLTGFDDIEINNLLEDDDEISEEEDDIPEVIENPISCLGDIWILGNHHLMCADSTMIDNVEKLMNGEKADMVFTDPPYNIDYDFSNNGMVQSGQRTAKFGKIKNDSMSDDNYDAFISDVFNNLFLNMKEGSSFYISSRRESTLTFNNILKNMDMHIQSWLIWAKEHFNISRLDYHPKHEIITYGWKKGAFHNWFGDRSQTDVISISRETRGNAIHLTQKPTALIEYFLKHSSRKNENILDLFGGSGSTLIACEKTNRKCYMMELDPKYCDVIIKRWQNLTQCNVVHPESGKPFNDLLNNKNDA